MATQTGFMADLGGGLLEPGSGQREELKTQFMTREGTYHLMALAEYTRPNRVGYNNQPATGSVPVKVSHGGPGGSNTQHFPGSGLLCPLRV